MGLTDLGFNKETVIWKVPVPLSSKLSVPRLTDSPSHYLYIRGSLVFKEKKKFLSHYTFSSHLHEVMDLREL